MFACYYVSGLNENQERKSTFHKTSGKIAAMATELRKFVMAANPNTNLPFVLESMMCDCGLRSSTRRPRTAVVTAPMTEVNVAAPDTIESFVEHVSAVKYSW